VGERELTVHVILNDKAIREISKDLEAKLRADGSANLSGQNPDPAGASQRVEKQQAKARRHPPKPKSKKKKRKSTTPHKRRKHGRRRLMGPSAAA
jgi:hypothetical protein